MRPIIDKSGALRGFMTKTYSEQLQEDLEPVEYIKAVADSMLPTRHPIYDCKFWIYEERRLAPYDEYMNFYRRLENGSNNKGQR